VAISRNEAKRIIRALPPHLKRRFYWRCDLVNDLSLLNFHYVR
jgi:hypothetical protein